ncbi:MAG: hypothetical protein QXR19_04800 [Candidatus Jordarchaeaceae archaeon]
MERNLADRPREGRPPKLDEKDKEEIRRLVEENDPTKHGVNASFWDCRELRQYFLKKGKNCFPRNSKTMPEKYGARYVKAEIEYAEANEDEGEKFARQFLRDLASKPDSVVVLFQDETAVGCSPRKGYGWTFWEKAGGKPPRPTGGG